MFVNRSFWDSPTANAIQQIQTAHALARQGAQVEYVLPTMQYVSPKDVLTRYGLVEHPNLTISLVLVPQKSQWAYRIFLILVMIKLVRKCLYGPRTVLLTRESILVLFTRMLRKTSFFELHDLGDVPNDRFQRKKGVQKRIQRAARQADGVITVTRSGAQEIQQVCNIDIKRILVAPDAAQLQSVESPRISLCDSTPVQVVYVGSMWKDRGVETIIYALQHLPPHHRVRLIMVGGNESQIASLQQLASQLGVLDNIKFVGYVSHHEVINWLARADILVLPMQKGVWTDKYASPMKLFEYMAMGRPMVVADVPTIREIVDEEQVMFFRPDDSPSLAATIAQAIEQWSVALVRADRAKTLLSQQYTYDCRAQKILAFIESMSS